MFSLNRNTGEITLSVDATVLENDIYYLPVMASDEAVPSERRTATTTLTIIQGRSTKGPKFTDDLYQAQIVENSPIGTPVSMVQLISSTDENPSFFVVDCETERGRNRGLFYADKDSGQIRTSRPIDRETEGDIANLHIVALFKDSISETKVSSSSLCAEITIPFYSLLYRLLLCNTIKIVFYVSF